MVRIAIGSGPPGVVRRRLEVGGIADTCSTHSLGLGPASAGTLGEDLANAASSVEEHQGWMTWMFSGPLQNALFLRKDPPTQLQSVE